MSLPKLNISTQQQSQDSPEQFLGKWVAVATPRGSRSLGVLRSVDLVNGTLVLDQVHEQRAPDPGGGPPRLVQLPTKTLHGKDIADLVLVADRDEQRDQRQRDPASPKGQSGTPGPFATPTASAPATPLPAMPTLTPGHSTLASSVPTTPAMLAAQLQALQMAQAGPAYMDPAAARVAQNYPHHLLQASTPQRGALDMSAAAALAAVGTAPLGPQPSSTSSAVPLPGATGGMQSLESLRALEQLMIQQESMMLLAPLLQQEQLQQQQAAAAAAVLQQQQHAQHAQQQTALLMALASALQQQQQQLPQMPALAAGRMNPTPSIPLASAGSAVPPPRPPPPAIVSAHSALPPQHLPPQIPPPPPPPPAYQRSVSVGGDRSGVATRLALGRTQLSRAQIKGLQALEEFVATQLEDIMQVTGSQEALVGADGAAAAGLPSGISRQWAQMVEMAWAQLVDLRLPVSEALKRLWEWVGLGFISMQQFEGYKALLIQHQQQSAEPGSGVEGVSAAAGLTSLSAGTNPAENTCDSGSTGRGGQASRRSSATNASGEDAAAEEPIAETSSINLNPGPVRRSVFSDAGAQQSGGMHGDAPLGEQEKQMLPGAAAARRRIALHEGGSLTQAGSMPLVPMVRHDGFAAGGGDDTPAMEGFGDDIHGDKPPAAHHMYAQSVLPGIGGIHPARLRSAMSVGGPHMRKSLLVPPPPPPPPPGGMSSSASMSVGSIIPVRKVVVRVVDVAALSSAAPPAGAPPPSAPTFTEFDLPQGLLQGLKDCGFKAPDTVQASLLRILMPAAATPPTTSSSTDEPAGVPLPATEPSAEGAEAAALPAPPVDPVGPDGVEVVCVHVPSGMTTVAMLCVHALRATAACEVPAPALDRPPVVGGRPAVLVVCPTRTEAEDVGDMCRAMAYHMQVPCYTHVGGRRLQLSVEPSGGSATGAAGGSDAPLSRLNSVSSSHPPKTSTGEWEPAAVAVATPGRVLDLLRRGLIDATCLRHLTLVEGAALMSVDFKQQIHQLLQALGGTLRRIVVITPTELPVGSMGMIERTLSCIRPIPPPPPPLPHLRPSLAREASAPLPIMSSASTLSGAPPTLNSSPSVLSRLNPVAQPWVPRPSSAAATSPPSSGDSVAAGPEKAAATAVPTASEAAAGTSPTVRAAGPLPVVVEEGTDPTGTPAADDAASLAAPSEPMEPATEGAADALAEPAAAKEAEAAPATEAKAAEAAPAKEADVVEAEAAAPDAAQPAAATAAAEAEAAAPAPEAQEIQPVAEMPAPAAAEQAAAAAAAGGEAAAAALASPEEAAQPATAVMSQPVAAEPEAVATAPEAAAPPAPVLAAGGTAAEAPEAATVAEPVADLPAAEAAGEGQAAAAVEPIAAETLATVEPIAAEVPAAVEPKLVEVPAAEEPTAAEAPAAEEPAAAETPAPVEPAAAETPAAGAAASAVPEAPAVDLAANAQFDVAATLELAAPMPASKQAQQEAPEAPAAATI